MVKGFFTDRDIKEIEKAGLTEGSIMDQIDIFNRGPTTVKLSRPCTVDDGIVVIAASDKKRLLEVYEKEVKGGGMIKFVPASGAASRMFRDWFRYYDIENFNHSETGKIFSENLSKFAFYDDLRTIVSNNGQSLQTLRENKNYTEILDYILNPNGLNYARLPKALIKFHAYGKNSRTALEEHLVEAVLYVNDASNVCKTHFTVSAEHESEVENFISSVKKSYEENYGINLDISLSIQHASSDTIAVDVNNRPFRDSSGKLVFRPGGHGALLRNLNRIDGDIVFLKNIDNVIPDGLKPETVFYKKVLGGYLIELQKEIFRHITIMSNNEISEKEFLNAINFCKEKLHITLPETFDKISRNDRKKFLLKKLNRPIRVCGMVKNEGEPGGGPFWVKENDETLSRQIIEEVQIDGNSEEQRKIWQSSTHFNPVDIVCGVKNSQGRKFDLEKYIDKNTYIIARKSQEGSDLKALELPGLWNGSMADWNTVFVEVPLSTFNPVKTIDDLLRKQHVNL
jgi:hypothetical protein